MRLPSTSELPPCQPRAVLPPPPRGGEREHADRDERPGRRLGARRACRWGLAVAACAHPACASDGRGPPGADRRTGRSRDDLAPGRRPARIKENPKMSAEPTAFWIDRDYDREHASDGISRYGAYLRDGVFGPWTDNDQAVEWAAFAWERATAPVMSPGYVRYHPRVLAANLDRSGWDGSLFAAVSLACPRPEQLTRALARAVRAGDRDVHWQDWPAEYAGKTCYYEPSEADVAARPYMLATLSLQFTVPSAALPEPPASSAAWLGAGRQPV